MQSFEGNEGQDGQEESEGEDQSDRNAYAGASFSSVVEQSNSTVPGARVWYEET